MKNWIICTVMLLMSATVNAGSFEVGIESFTEIRGLGNFKVILKKGDTTKIEVNNSDEDLEDEKVICEVKKDILTLRLKGDTYKERDLEFVVYYTEIEKITAKLGCRLEVAEPIDQDSIELTTESGGKIRATVSCKKLYTYISAGGSIHVDGEADFAEYKISAGGTIGAVNVKARSIEAIVTAGGEIICAVEEDLAIKITSGGNVSYMGEPEGFEQNVTLGGKITKLKNRE